MDEVNKVGGVAAGSHEAGVQACQDICHVTPTCAWDKQHLRLKCTWTILKRTYICSSNTMNFDSKHDEWTGHGVFVCIYLACT